MSAAGDPYSSYAVATTLAPDGHYRLFGADASYYTAKLDAWLAYKRIPHRRELATREIFAQEILPRVGYPVIPVLVAPDGRTLQDTSEIIDLLEVLHPTPPTLPSDPAARFLCLLFELFCDEWIKVPALHYRWHHDAEFAALEFGRNNDPALATARQREIGAKIAARFAGWCEPLGITPHTIPAIEADYLELLRLLDAHFAQHASVLGGPPSLCDFALYGPFHAHLLRDPNSGRVMRANAPQVVAWIEGLRGVPPASSTLDLDVTRLPDTLWPVLELLARDYVPVLVDQHRAVQAWLAQAPPGAVPREVGTHAVVFGRGTAHEVSGSRALFTYDSWMLQRALDVYAGSMATARADIESLCAQLGATALLALDTAQRLRRERYSLVHG